MQSTELFTELETLTDRLVRSWGAVGHLKSVKDTPELRDAIEKAMPQRIALGLRMGQSKPLYRQWCKLKADDAAWDNLSEAERRIADAELRDASLAGVGLEGVEKARFIEITQELATLSTQFSNNVSDATLAYKLVLTAHDEVAGIPPTALALAADRAKGEGHGNATQGGGPWLFLLDAPSFVPVVSHCENRHVREQMYRAYVTRASDQAAPPGADAADGAGDNTPLIKQILALRQESAGLLGYAHHGEVSCASKMATFDEAVALMEQLKTHAYAFATAEFIELQQFAELQGFEGEMEPWDRAFYAERMREERFAFQEEELRPYFSLPRVLDGLFALGSRLFDIEIAPATEQPPVWDSEVVLYEVSKGGKPVAAFFLDAFSRPAEKRGGAWMDECMSKLGDRLPVAHVVCNQNPPVGDQPSLMTFREVETLFHEFG